MEQAIAAGSEPVSATRESSQQHPISVYLYVWFLLFVLSTFSYLVDYFDLHGLLRWSLIIIFMLLKAGFIVAIFMHIKWERFALITAILTPPAAILVLIAFMVSEGDYVFDKRVDYFDQPEQAVRMHVEHEGTAGGEHGEH